MNPKKYQQLRHGIIFMIMIFSGGFVLGGGKPEVKIAFIEEFQSVGKINKFNIKEIRQIRIIEKKFKRKLENVKGYKIQIFLIPNSEFHYGSSPEDFDKEIEKYSRIAKQFDSTAVIKGSYTFTEDLFILNFKLYDIKTGTFFSFPINSKLKEDQELSKQIEKKLEKVSKKIIEKIISLKGEN